jgi:IS4 transposase
MSLTPSTMSMSLSQYPWATFRKTKAGVRLHLRVVVTKDQTIPDKAVLLPAKHADRTQMDELVEMDSDSIYLFDRGYVDYQKFDHYCLNGLRFITRLKKNAEIEVLNEQEPNPEHLIFQEMEVYFGNHMNGTNMQHTLRLIRTKDSDDNPVTIVTNCFDLTAKEIADLYRYRWKIETFFKWMKQHLKIKTFYGKSQNAVYNQIWMALITYCLQVLIQLKCHHKGNLLDVQRCLVDSLFKELNEFIQSLFPKPSRSSMGRREYDWEQEFQLIVRQFNEGEVSHLNDLTYDPLFL